MRINLLPQLSVEERKVLRKKRLLELVSVVGLTVAILLVLAVFGYWAVLNNEIGLVQQKIAQAETKVNQLADRESLLRGYKQKIEFLTTVIDKRPPLYSFLFEFYRLLPAGVSFSEVTLQEEQIVVSGVAVSSLELGEFIDRLKGTPTLAGKEIAKVALTSLVKEKGGYYKFSLKLTLG